MKMLAPTRVLAPALLIAFATALAPAVGHAEAAKWVRLSWADADASTSMGVTWNTDGGGQPTEVQYGTTTALGMTASGTSFKANGTVGYVHEVELYDLTPDTTYHYRVGGDGAWGNLYSFRTGPKPGCGAIRFVALGDGRSQDEVGPAPGWQDIYAEALGEDPAFVLNTGDLVKEGNNTNQWTQWLSETAPLLPGVPHMPSLGNHDDDKAEGDNAAYNQVFQLPRNTATETEDFYYFTFGDAIFVSLSTATYSSGSAPYQVQADWLDKVLTDNPRTWKIVYFHHPIYTSFVEAFGIELNHPPNEVGQNPAFVPIFDKHHVDLVLMGHNHFYERFAPMKGGGGSPTGNPMSDPSEGTIYVITGGAGAFTYDEVFGFDPMGDLVCSDVFQAPGSQLCSGKHHFVSFDIEGGTMTATVIATSSQNFSNDPNNIEIIDTFAISKWAPASSDCAPVDPPPPDGADAGSSDSPDAAGGDDAGNDIDAGTHDDTITADAIALDVSEPSVGGDTGAAGGGFGDIGTEPPTETGDGDGKHPGTGGAANDLDDTFGTGGAAPTGAGGGNFGPSEGSSPGISPVPTPNNDGLGGGSTASGCNAGTRAPRLPLWLLVVVGVLALTASQRRLRLTALAGTVLLGALLGSACKSDPPAKTPTPAEATRRPAESEGRADEPGPPSQVGSAGEPSDQTPAPAQVPGDGGEHVLLETLGGFQLGATLYPAKDPKAPAVVLLHQLRSDRSEWSATREALLEGADLTLLTVDLRGHGESAHRGDEQVTWKQLREADYMQMVADVRSAVAYLRGRQDLQPRALLLLGSSIGGSAALVYAEEDPSIRTVVALSPGLDYHGLATLPAVRAMKDRPVLLIASRDDKYSTHSTRVLGAEAAQGSKADVIEGSDAHGVAILAEHPETMKLLVDWVVSHST